MNTSPLYVHLLPMPDLVQHTGNWANAAIALRSSFVPYSQPDALLLTYHFLHHGSELGQIDESVR